MNSSPYKNASFPKAGLGISLNVPSIYDIAEGNVPQGKGISP